MDDRYQLNVNGLTRVLDQLIENSRIAACATEDARPVEIQDPALRHMHNKPQNIAKRAVLEGMLAHSYRAPQSDDKRYHTPVDEIFSRSDLPSGLLSRAIDNLVQENIIRRAGHGAFIKPYTSFMETPHPEKLIAYYKNIGGVGFGDRSGDGRADQRELACASHVFIGTHAHEIQALLTLLGREFGGSLDFDASPNTGRLVARIHIPPCLSLDAHHHHAASRAENLTLALEQLRMGMLTPKAEAILQATPTMHESNLANPFGNPAAVVNIKELHGRIIDNVPLHAARLPRTPQRRKKTELPTISYVASTAANEPTGSQAQL